ncbi:MAG: hypothetical protein GWN58_27565 [Anaerolineae bacterium]|nr:hypothetical protein [Anaerolineae bacterium]
MSLSHVEVKSGQRIAGRYRRGGREAGELKLAVHAVIVYRNATMLIGTDLASGRVISVYAECFDPREFTVSDGVEGDELDVSNYYITTGSRAFSFLEEPSEEDREWAELLGGKPVSTFKNLESAVIVITAPDNKE